MGLADAKQPDVKMRELFEQLILRESKITFGFDEKVQASAGSFSETMIKFCEEIEPLSENFVNTVVLQQNQNFRIDNDRASDRQEIKGMMGNKYKMNGFFAKGRGQFDRASKERNVLQMRYENFFKLFGSDFRGLVQILNCRQDNVFVPYSELID